MIIRSTFRGPGGLAAHLSRADTNESVRVRDDLSRGCELSISAAIDDFAALGDVDDCILHVSVSPSVPLTDAQAARAIDVIQEAYEISAGQPILVIEHVKPGETRRPQHFHAAIPRRDIITGKLIRDAFRLTKNDRAAAQLDAEFGAPIVPVVHAAAVESWLSENAPATLEIINAAGGLQAPERSRDRETGANKRRAADAGVDLVDFGERALNIFDKSGGKPSETHWFIAGLRLARGDKCTMLVDVETGYASALDRTLNVAARRRGDARRWSDSDLCGLLGNNAPSLSAAITASKPPVTKKRRGRPPRATDAEIEAERASRTVILAVAVKSDGYAYGETKKTIGQAKHEPEVGVGAASFVNAVVLDMHPSAAAATYLLKLLEKRRRFNVVAQEKTITETSVRQDFDAHFERPRPVPALTIADWEALPVGDRQILFFSKLSFARGHADEMDRISPLLSGDVARRILKRILELCAHPESSTAGAELTLVGLDSIRSSAAIREIACQFADARAPAVAERTFVFANHIDRMLSSDQTQSMESSSGQSSASKGYGD